MIDSTRYAVIGMLMLCAGCHKATAVKRPLIVIVSGDTAGWIVPCGCTANQSGGLLRRATYVQSVATEAKSLYVDVGGAIHGESDYDREKFEAILKGELLMNVQAHNIGAGEARLGPTFLLELKSKLRVPFVSCNVRQPTGELIGESFRIVNQSGQRIAIVGVCSDRGKIQGVKVEPPREAILDTLRSNRLKYDSLVVLAYLDEEELSRLAVELPEADIIVGGPTGQSIKPHSVGPTLVASATNKGRFLARFDSPTNSSDNWTGTVVEMDRAWSDDRKQQDNLNDFYKRLADRDFPAADTPFVESLSDSVPLDFKVAGSSTCRDCHREDHTHWASTSHSKAWQSLSRTGAEVDAYCQQCHTTSFGMPGGFVSAKRTPQHVDVGCESCHGPSNAHVEDTRVHTAYFGQAVYRCDRCHDRENSPNFVRNDYWLQIRHGEKLE